MPRLASKQSTIVDVSIFMATLFLANWLWKLMVHGDEAGVGVVTWFGLDATSLFDAYARHIAKVVYAIVHTFRDTLVMTDDVTMHFVDGGGTRIVWSCTPIKQMFIWFCLILTTPNYKFNWFNKLRTKPAQPVKPAKPAPLSTLNWNKLWFIPLGCLLIHFINLARISAITAFMEFHPEWFELLHTYIFKYLFYGILFLFWVFYIEKIRKSTTLYCG